MAFKLPITALVILLISIVALILGSIYLMNITIFSKEVIETELPTPYLQEETRKATRVDIVVTPSTSQQGTVFAIVADTWPLTESQALHLTIEGEGESSSIVLFDDGNHFDEEANDGLFGTTLDSQNLELGTYQIKDPDENILAEFTVQDSVCQPLIGVPAYEKVNFLLLPYGYEDIEEFKEDARKIILGRKTISQIEPFKSNFNELSFSYFVPSEDLECEVGCRNIETMVCCKDPRVAEAAAQCNYDSVIVLVNSDVGCGTASYYTRVCAKSSNAGLILAHELGHSFAGLADEYVYSDYFDYNIAESLILEMPNCDTEGCEKWSSLTDECYKGCTSPNLYRPSKNSIMRYVSNGEFNEISSLAVRNEIDLRVAREIDMQARNSEGKSYFVNLNLRDEKVSLSPVARLPVRAGVTSITGHFTARLKDENGVTLHSTKVPLPLFEFPALDISEKPILRREISVPINLPYIPSAQTLEITEGQETLAITSLATFSDNCGNDICDPSENRITCMEDCNLTNDNFCEDYYCDPDCPPKDNCPEASQGRMGWIAVLILVSLIAIVIVLMKSRTTS